MKKLLLLLVLAVIAGGAYYLWREDKLGIFGRGGQIEAVILQYEGDIDGQPDRMREWIADDRMRREIEGSEDRSTVIVRLDKGEVWVLNDRDKTCDVLEIEKLKRAVEKAAQRELERCRQDPNWANQIGALESYMLGNYDAQVSPTKVTRRGYECTEVCAQVGSLIRMRALRSSDKRVPASAADARDAVAFATIGKFAPASRHWIHKASRFGDLSVYSEVWLNLPSPAMKSHAATELASIKVQKVDRSLFELPKGYRVTRIGED